MRPEINSKSDYDKVMLTIYKLMNKGAVNLSAEDMDHIQNMATAVEVYEDTFLGLKPFT